MWRGETLFAWLCSVPRAERSSKLHALFGSAHGLSQSKTFGRPHPNCLIAHDKPPPTRYPTDTNGIPGVDPVQREILTWWRHLLLIKIFMKDGGTVFAGKRRLSILVSHFCPINGKFLSLEQTIRKGFSYRRYSTR